MYFGVRARNLPTVTEENQKELQSVQSVSGSGYQSGSLVNTKL
jgi:hypothetical protein